MIAIAVTLTTGVLVRNVKTRFAFVELVNFSGTSKRVRFRVIDWTFRRPRIISSFVVRLRGNRGETAGASLASRVARYEIEITLLGNCKRKPRDFVANCFGTDSGERLVSKLFEGNTVLFKDLVLKSSKTK